VAKRAPASPPAAAAGPKGFVQTPVLAIFDETSDIKTFRMGRPDGFEFQAGQFLAVRIRVDAQDYVRCYSISSAPEARGYLEISVKRAGIVSNALHATARPGATLSVKAPAGAFRYPSSDDRPILLLAGGIGITPLISMLRHATAAEPTRPVTLIYASQSESGFAFCDEMSALARRHPQVRMYFAVSGASTQPHVYKGRIDEHLLRAVVPELIHSICFICGPTPMLEGMRTLLASLGVPDSQIRFEVFQAAVAVAARVEPDAAADAPSSSGVTEPAPAAAAGVVQMSCAKSGRQVAVQPGQTLLEAAEAAGVDVPSLCRAGVCGTCRIQVSAGDVNCESSMLRDDDRSQGFVLACVTTAATDCTVQV
jgi:ferredoxin-NADP reductase